MHSTLQFLFLFKIKIVYDQISIRQNKLVILSQKNHCTTIKVLLMKSMVRMLHSYTSGKNHGPQSQI